ncbi:pantoate--beta-alanine ligase [soil metagenome]
MTPIAATIAEVREAVATARQQSLRIGCVPTMGALHDGHASLIRRAKAISDFVVVTLFVNPTQFGPNEDYTRYPRTLDADRSLCAHAGANVVFVPSVGEIYPDNAVTFVDVALLGEHLCGPSRPGHFRGVCTVVLKLLNIVLPDVAVFGAKDGQQARIIRTMVRDLNVPTVIDIAPTVRDADGLAMSSRNRYLNETQRTVAPRIYQALLAVKERVANGETDIARLESALHAQLVAIPGSRVDYARIVSDDTLQPLTRLDRPALVAVAVFLGTTRLIDNITI